jgi:hypothetical protein
VARAARVYLARMLLAHLGSYPLAVAAGWAAGQLARSGVRTAASETLTAAVVALAVMVPAWVVANWLAHRWALSAAALRVARDGEWVAWVVTRLLERASAEDRRGRGAVMRVVGLLGGAGVGSRMARLALERVGASTITRVAEVLARIPPGSEPIGTRVHRAMVDALAREQRLRVAAMVAVVAVVAVVAGAVVVAAGR